MEFEAFNRISGELTTMFETKADLMQTMAGDPRLNTPEGINPENLDLIWRYRLRQDGTCAIELDRIQSQFTPTPAVLDWLLKPDGQLKTADELLGEWIRPTTDKFADGLCEGYGVMTFEQPPYL